MKDRTKPGYVYKIIFDIPEPHVVYVGSTTQQPNERLGHHSTIQKRPTKLNQFIRQNGKEHFSIEIIEWVPDRDKRFEREKYWTEQYKDIPDNCNMCIGTTRPEELRLDASINCYRNHEVVCENDGKHYRSGMEASIAYGLACSDVTECCAMHLRQSKGYYFRYADVDRQLYIAYWESAGVIRNRPVRCIETKEIYKNAVAAGRALGVGHDVVARCCERKGILRKSKLHLEYVKPYAVLPSLVMTDSDSLSCEMSSMQASIHIDGSLE